MRNGKSDVRRSYAGIALSALVLAAAVVFALTPAMPAPMQAGATELVRAEIQAERQLPWSPQGDDGGAGPESAPIGPCRLILSETDVFLDGSAPARLSARVEPASAASLPGFDPSRASWASSDESVATVDSTGRIWANGDGSATVTASLPGGPVAEARVVVSLAAPEAEQVPVLTYHRVCGDWAKLVIYPDQNLAISETDFAGQLDWLDANGYRTVTAGEFERWYDGEMFLPEKTVMLTFDDGLYETYHVAYPELAKRGMAGTAFVIGAKTPETTEPYDPYGDDGDLRMGEDAIAEIRRDYPRLEIQSHTYDLHRRGPDGYGVVGDLSYEELADDIAANGRFGFCSLAYPFGHTSEAMFRAVEDAPDITMAFGYQMGYPATRWSYRYEIPRYKICGDATLDEFAARAQGMYVDVF